MTPLPPRPEVGALGYVGFVDGIDVSAFQGKIAFVAPEELALLLRTFVTGA